MKKPSFLSLAIASFALCMGLVTTARAQDAKAGDVVAGEKKVAMCIGCHNIPGYQASFPEIYKVPKIAGQNAKYIASALTAYRKGERRHPTMRAIAASLSDQDIADVAAYYSHLGQPDGPVPATLAVAVPDRLRTAMATCTACHGVNFSTPTDGTIPRLAGQHGDYMLYALKAYQTEGNPNFGRKNAVMNAMAKPLSNADIEQITAWITSLPGELRTVPQPKFK